MSATWPEFPEPAITFESLRERTPSLSGPQRMQLFHRLPLQVQTAMWNHLQRQHFDPNDHDRRSCHARLTIPPIHPRG